jgi:hypothetical protein
MEVNIVSNTGANYGQTPNVNNRQEASAAVAPKAENAEKDTALNKLQKVTDVTGAEKERLETVIKAAKQLSNYYVVSDTSFSIYKDSSGQFITRFTSLKDGSVTYIPETNMANHLKTASAQSNLAIGS